MSWSRSHVIAVAIGIVHIVLDDYRGYTVLLFVLFIIVSYDAVTLDLYPLVRSVLYYMELL